MQTIFKLRLRCLLADNAGATAIEYGLIVALIAIAIITSVQGLGNEIGTTFTGIENKMAEGNSAAA